MELDEPARARVQEPQATSVQERTPEIEGRKLAPGGGVTGDGMVGAAQGHGARR